MMKLSTTAALVIVSATSGAYAADAKGMSGIQGMEGKKK